MVEIAGEVSFDYAALRMGEGGPALMKSSHPERSSGTCSLETVSRFVHLKRRKKKPSFQKALLAWFLSVLAVCPVLDLF